MKRTKRRVYPFSLPGSASNISTFCFTHTWDKYLWADIAQAHMQFNDWEFNDFIFFLYHGPKFLETD